MRSGDLVNLATVKAWTSPQSGGSANPDQLLRRLISAASRAVTNYCNRDTFKYGQFVEIANGTGNASLMLRNWPVEDIESIDLGTGTILSSPSTGSPPSSGFKVSGPNTAPQLATLIGYYFPAGRSNITITYNAGFRISDEEEEVYVAPDGTATIDLEQAWLEDLGVTLNGEAMTKVAEDPGDGEYSVDTDGFYTFNAAQSGADVKVSYSYCPPDIVQAVIELVGERYKAMTRIGESSHSLGGSANVTVSFSTKDMNDTIKTFLRNYTNVVPI